MKAYDVGDDLLNAVKPFYSGVTAVIKVVGYEEAGDGGINNTRLL